METDFYTSLIHPNFVKRGEVSTQSSFVLHYRDKNKEYIKKGTYMAENFRLGRGDQALI